MSEFYTKIELKTRSQRGTAGLKLASEEQTDVWANGWMDRETELPPVRCTALPPFCLLQCIVWQGKGAADLVMPLGDLQLDYSMLS